MSHVAHASSRRLAWIAVIVGLCAGLVGPPALAGADKPSTQTIAIDGTTFIPQTITVKAGSTVVWENKDPFPHTATSQAAGFDSRAIKPGKSWKYKATKTGDFSYVCAYHPTMTATLRVE